jgi:predicted solute-binding protein
MRLNEGKQNQLNFREMKQTEMITLKKTAMQEMIAYFEIFQGQDKSNKSMPLGIAISIAKSLLEQEKEQIMDAYDEGWSDAFADKDLNAEYYFETFKTNEK